MKEIIGKGPMGLAEFVENNKQSEGPGMSRTGIVKASGYVRFEAIDFYPVPSFLVMGFAKDLSNGPIQKLRIV